MVVEGEVDRVLADNLAQDGGSVMSSLERCPDFGELPVLEGHCCRGAVVQNTRAGRQLGRGLGRTAWLSRWVYDIGRDAWRFLYAGRRWQVCDEQAAACERACTETGVGSPECNWPSAFVLAAT